MIAFAVTDLRWGRRDVTTRAVGGAAALVRHWFTEQSRCDGFCGRRVSSLFTRPAPLQSLLLNKLHGRFPESFGFCHTTFPRKCRLVEWQYRIRTTNISRFVTRD